LLRETNQMQFGIYPRQWVIDAHGAAHEYQSSHIVDAGRNAVTAVDGDETGRDLVAIQVFAEITGSFTSDVSEYIDGFHGCTVGLIE